MRRLEIKRQLDEHRWLDMARDGRSPFAGLVAREPDHDHPVAYAQVSRGRERSWALDLAIDPHHRDDERTIAPELLGAALEVIGDEGGGRVHLWVHQPTGTHDEIAAEIGLRRDRDLLQLRRPLPVEAALPDLDVRPFRPGVDEDAWLEVNNRAFQEHPEQGEWTRADVEAREREPWFEPDGFLLHEITGLQVGRLAGFCWTKVHADHDPPLGEIYVIAVDPDFGGKGLGRALVLHGLDHLARQGLGWAMLYVDAANAPAVGLYEDLGFRVHHVDRAYTGEVDAR